MGNWPALLVAPAVALADQSVIYALVTPSCAHQTTLAPHLVSAASLAACIWMSWGAWRNWRTAKAEQGPDAGDTDGAQDRRFFLAPVALTVGALSSLVVLAMWFPQWVLSPCFV